MPKCALCHEQASSSCAICMSFLCSDHLFPLSRHQEGCSRLSIKSFMDAASRHGLYDRRSQEFIKLSNMHTDWVATVVSIMDNKTPIQILEPLFKAFRLSIAIFGPDRPQPQDAAIRLLNIALQKPEDTSLVMSVITGLLDYMLKMTPKTRWLYNLLIVTSCSSFANLRVVSFDGCSTPARAVNQAVFLLLTHNYLAAYSLFDNIREGDCSSGVRLTLQYVQHCAKLAYKGRRQPCTLVTEKELETSFLVQQNRFEDVTTFFMQCYLYYSHYNTATYASSTVHEKLLFARQLVRDMLHTLKGRSFLSVHALAGLYINVLGVLVETSSGDATKYCKEAESVYTHFLFTKSDGAEGPAYPYARVQKLSREPFKRLHYRLPILPSELSSSPMLVPMEVASSQLQFEIALNVADVMNKMVEATAKKKNDRKMAQRVATSLVGQRILPLQHRAASAKQQQQSKAQIQQLRPQSGKHNIPVKPRQYNSVSHDCVWCSSSHGVAKAQLRVHNHNANIAATRRHEEQANNSSTIKLTVAADCVDLDILEERLSNSSIKEFIQSPSSCSTQPLMQTVSSPYSRKSVQKLSGLDEERITEPLPDTLHKSTHRAQLSNGPKIDDQDIAFTDLEALSPESKAIFTEARRVAADVVNMEAPDRKDTDIDTELLLAESCGVIDELQSCCNEN